MKQTMISKNLSNRKYLVMDIGIKPFFRLI